MLHRRWHKSSTRVSVNLWKRVSRSKNLEFNYLLFESGAIFLFKSCDFESCDFHWRWNHFNTGHVQAEDYIIQQKTIKINSNIKSTIILPFKLLRCLCKGNFIHGFLLMLFFVQVSEDTLKIRFKIQVRLRPGLGRKPSDPINFQPLNFCLFSESTQRLLLNSRIEGP